MRKKIKSSVSILLIVLSVFFSLTINSKIAQAEDKSLDTNTVNLVLDSSNYKEMPKNFRKTSDLTYVKNNKELNLSGLDKLNISGSQQFSEYSLPLLIKSIGTPLPITVYDLRQESHGFINGAPVSWKNKYNDANKGLTKEQVLKDESNKLKSIKLNTPISFYNHPEITMVPTKVEDENKLTNSQALSYIRIPVTDGKIPTDDMVDYFVELVKAQPKDSWFHFHCKEGIGRTTTFMIMYDMIKNSKEVTSKDIINRQLQLAKFDASHISSFTNPERTNLLENFYKYTKEAGKEFNIKYSDWKKKQ